MSDRSKSRSRSRSRSRSKSRDKTEEGSGDEEIYEVEEIRDKRRGDDGDWLYYVKWVGWDSDTNTWVGEVIWAMPERNRFFSCEVFPNCIKILGVCASYFRSQ